MNMRFFFLSVYFVMPITLKFYNHTRLIVHKIYIYVIVHIEFWDTHC